MLGVGETSALPPSLALPQTDVRMYWSGRKGWQALQPSSEGTSSWISYMGPEVTFGRAMKDAHPDREVYLIKHARGGTALADWWNPGAGPDDTEAQGEGYKTLKKTIDDGLALLSADSVEYEISGMIWMQGESDAVNAGMAAAYEENLGHFIARIRKDVSVPELPFIIGEIACPEYCTYRTLVVQAQRSVAGADPFVRSFDTLDLERTPSDLWHYGGIAQRVLGQRFAASLLDESTLPAYPSAAIEITGSYTANYTGAFTVGWEFESLEAVWVTDLGVFDLGNDGLYHSTRVGIWEEDTKTLRVEGDVYGSFLLATPLHQGFRYGAVDPVLLPPGRYVIGNVSYADTPDYYVYEAEITESSSIDWTGSRHIEGTHLTFPNVFNATSEDEAAWFGPNLMFIPE